MNNNPWYWADKSRQQFESELQRDAVLLQLKDNRKSMKSVVPFTAPKVDIEAVRARKNALVAAGILKPDIALVKARKNAAAGISNVK